MIAPGQNQFNHFPGLSGRSAWDEVRGGASRSALNNFRAFFSGALGKSDRVRARRFMLFRRASCGTSPHRPGGVPANFCMATFKAPEAFIPVIQVAQPDGSVLVRPGALVVYEPTISTREAARILGVSIRTVSYQCEIGLFKTACKPGGTPRSPWRIAASEVQARRNLNTEL